MFSTSRALHSAPRRSFVICLAPASQILDRESWETAACLTGAKRPLSAPKAHGTRPSRARLCQRTFTSLAVPNGLLWPLQSQACLFVAFASAGRFSPPGHTPAEEFEPGPAIRYATRFCGLTRPSACTCTSRLSCIPNASHRHRRHHEEHPLARRVYAALSSASKAVPIAGVNFDLR